MAKSKNGGTRSFIKGRIGSDVYSVGKDGKGNRQQVVRSLAEQVSNPRTEAQMQGRMIMSTVMQVVSAMSQIVDHSFDGLAKGQPNISEFIRRNYALLKADVLAHPSSGNKWGLNKYQEKGCHAGKYVISNGSATAPSGMTLANGAGQALSLAIGETLNGAALKAAWGLNSEEYVTLVAWAEDSARQSDGIVNLIYARLSIKDSIADDTVYTAATLPTAFNIEGNANVECTFSESVATVRITSDSSVYFGLDTAIISRKSGSGFIHNSAIMGVSGNPSWNASVALPTYPTGSNQFLNGGEL